MRKTLASVGWAMLLSWVVMFLAFFGQLATVAGHYTGMPVNPISVTLIGGVLGAALVIILIGHLSK